MTVEDAELFLFDRLEDCDWHWSADVKVDGKLRGLTPKLLWLAIEPRGLAPVQIVNVGFPRRTVWRLDPEVIAQLDCDPDESEQVSRHDLIAELARTIEDAF